MSWGLCEMQALAGGRVGRRSREMQALAGGRVGGRMQGRAGGRLLQMGKRRGTGRLGARADERCRLVGGRAGVNAQ
jgi:hypothetical protein